MTAAKSYEVSYPVRHGQIDNWTHMEMMWEQTIFKYLRAEPEDLSVMYPAGLPADLRAAFLLIQVV